MKSSYYRVMCFVRYNQIVESIAIQFFSLKKLFLINLYKALRTEESSNICSISFMPLTTLFLINFSSNYPMIDKLIYNWKTV